MYKLKEKKQGVVLDITEETRIGDYVLEPGDRVKVLNERNDDVYWFIELPSSEIGDAFDVLDDNGYTRHPDVEETEEGFEIFDEKVYNEIVELLDREGIRYEGNVYNKYVENTVYSLQWVDSNGIVHYGEFIYEPEEDAPAGYDFWMLDSFVTRRELERNVVIGHWMQNAVTTAYEAVEEEFKNARFDEGNLYLMQYDAEYSSSYPPLLASLENPKIIDQRSFE